MSEHKKSKRKSSEHDATDEKPKRKRARRDADHKPEETLTDALSAVDAPTGKKKKSSKRRAVAQDDPTTPDPAQDSTLNQQAQKVLSYVYQWDQARDSWKFSKANQKWLLKNFFNADQVPIAYEGLGVRYLSTVNGLSRRRLLSVCEAAAGKVEEAAETSAETRRAGLLLPLLSEPNESV